jgi:hypothetical protein
VLGWSDHLFSKPLIRTGWLYLRLRRFGLFVRPERPADRPSLAWPPVADVLSATLKGQFSLACRAFRDAASGKTNQPYRSSSLSRGSQ